MACSSFYTGAIVLFVPASVFTSYGSFSTYLCLSLFMGLLSFFLQMSLLYRYSAYTKGKREYSDRVIKGQTVLLTWDNYSHHGPAKEEKSAQWRALAALQENIAFWAPGSG